MGKERSVRTQQASRSLLLSLFSKKALLVNGEEVSCSKCVPVSPGVSEPVGAGTNCFLHLPWQQGGGSSVQSPVMHFGVLGVGFWVFFIVSSSFLDRGVPVVRF